MIKALGEFFKDIGRSFYGPSLYAAGAQKSVWRAWFFLFLVSAITSLAATAYIGTSFYPVLKSFSEEDFVSRFYPEGVELSITNGKASVNQPVPYMLATPEAERVSSSTYPYLLVVDTRPDVSLSEINAYDTFAVLTEDSLIVHTEKDTRVLPLEKVENMHITRAAAEEWQGKFASVIRLMFWPLVFILWLLIAIGSTIAHAIASVFGALLVWLIASLRKAPYKYGESYKIAVLASVPILIIDTAAFLILNTPEPLPGLATTALFALIVWLNLKQNPV